MKRRNNQRLYADFKQAAALLHDDLVWSSDMEAIRRPLARYIANRATDGLNNDVDLIEIVQNLIADENDITIDLKC